MLSTQLIYRLSWQGTPPCFPTPRKDTNTSISWNVKEPGTPQHLGRFHMPVFRMNHSEADDMGVFGYVCECGQRKRPQDRIFFLFRAAAFSLL